MEVKVTASAAQELRKKIDEKGGNLAVRVYIAGVGWGGPSFGIALDEQKATDNVYEVEGVKVLFDKESSAYTKGFQIDYRTSIFGSRFFVEQLYSSGSCR